MTYLRDIVALTLAVCAMPFLLIIIFAFWLFQERWIEA